MGQAHYSKAWKIINQAEQRLGIKFLESQVGVYQGGGSRLTMMGKTFLERYSGFIAKADECLHNLFVKWVKTN